MKTDFKYFKYKIYCDMDGVLVNFDDAFKKIILNESNSDNLGNTFFAKYALKHGWKDTWNIIEEHGVDFWLNLEWMTDGKRLWNYLTNNFKEVEILTGSPLYKVGEYAKEGKNEWCKKNLGSNVKVNHKEGKLKQEFAKSKFDILIDDAPRNYENWIEHGGTGILHKNTDETIKELDKL